MNHRTINWFEHSVQSLESRHPWCKNQGSYLVERLTALLLERLPPGISGDLLALLPEQTMGNTPLGRLEKLYSSARSGSDASIGYHEFIQRATLALGVCGIGTSGTDAVTEGDLRKSAERIADHFLWSIAQEFPPDLKSTLLDHLPAELRNRMDLYSAHSDDSKVA